MDSVTHPDDFLFDAPDGVVHWVGEQFKVGGRWRRNLACTDAEVMRTETVAGSDMLAQITCPACEAMYRAAYPGSVA